MESPHKGSDVQKGFPWYNVINDIAKFPLEYVSASPILCGDK